MEAREVIKWLNICATDCHAEECKKCPYKKDDYEAGCGKLLSDAALLLDAAYPAAYPALEFPEEEKPYVKIGPAGLEMFDGTRTLIIPSDL